MKKKLVCHTDLYMRTSGELSAVKGKIYDVVSENSFIYSIINELGERHTFSKESNSVGRSYKAWFYLIEEEEKTNMDIKLEIKYTIEANDEESMLKITEGLLSNGYVLNVDNEDGKYKINIFNRRKSNPKVVYAGCACQQ